MKRIFYFLVSLFFLLLTFDAHAGHEQIVLSRCGKTGFSPIVGIPSGTSMTIEDQWYSYMQGHGYSPGDPTSWDNIFRVKSAVTKVSLRYDDDRHYAATQPWAIRVTYDITNYDSSGASYPLTSEILLITYDPADGTTYTDLGLKEYTDTHKSVLGIRTVEYFADGNLSHSSTATIPAELADVYLDLENDVERYYQIDATTPTIHQFTNGESSISLGWDYILGAESYDVEWLFIDGGTASLTASPGFDYDWRNATRVNIPGNKYTIELAYPRGIVLMRVRPVGIDFWHYVGTGFLVRGEGTWSYANETGNTYTDASAITSAHARLSGDIATGREPLLNWQYSASFAEDGKKKEGIGFYDGAMYNRQGLTRSNSDTNLIVAETRYDYEGRPAVQLLPTPVSIDDQHPDVLKYQRDFNSGFDRAQFDIDPSVGNAPAMDTTTTTTGAFYSGSNTATDRGKNYTATANGYAYTQVHYKNDGTNRPSSQSGVGENFREGSGREVKYYYGTPTGQVELDRLFGNEVGYVKHYQKNLVVDPNGQVSVSYLDQEGRVIATALGGDTPDNLMTLDNTNTDATSLEADLIGNNTLTQDNEMVSFNTITVSGTTTFSFAYTVSGDTACGIDRCYDVCADCKYDIEITVLDENNNVVTPLSGDNPVTASNISSGGYYFSMELPVGVYRVKKVLRLNQSNLDDLRADFIAAIGSENTCVNGFDTIAEPCALDCHAACEGLYKRADGEGWLYYDTNGDQITENDEDGHTPAQQAQTLIDACELQMCDAPPMPDPCSLKYQNMLLDMAPSGQYFDNTPAKDSVDADGDIVTIANYYTVYSPSYFSGHINDWLELSDHSSAMLAAINAVWSDTDFTTWDEVRDHWDTAWARILIEWHPEYCAWNYYCNQSCTIDTNETDPGGTVTLTEENDHHYDQLFFYSTNGNYPNTSSSAPDLEFFNPTNITQVSSYGSSAWASDHSDYQPYTDGLTNYYIDPRMEGCHFTVCSEYSVSALYRLNYYLEHFLPLYNSSDALIADTYHSIWYVIDDPENIHLGTPTSTGLSQHTIDFYVALHGDGSSNGILTTAGGTVTPFQFFAGVYAYYRQLVIDQGFVASDEVADCQEDHHGSAYGYLTTADGHGPLTSEGFTVYFPKNPLLDLHGNACDSISTDDLFTAMGDYVDGLATTYDTEDNNLETSYDQAICSCNNLNQFIIENNLSDALADNDYQTIADALNNTLELSALHDGDYTAEEVENWITTCGEESYTMTDLNDDNFPPDLACAPETTEVDVETVDELLQEECNQENDALANANAGMLNATQIEAAANTYINQFTATCLRKVATKETFLVDYDLKEYHYTLYYYDQAGNLVKTVPPEGVKIVDLTADADADGNNNGDEITLYRKDQLNGTTSYLIDYQPAIHGMITDYKYNSLQKPRTQISPDETDTTKFYYDYLGRIILSQNARQRDAGNEWSYTLYDALGRPYESGQVTNSTSLPSNLSTSITAFGTWMGSASSKEQVVHTQYDESLTGVAALFPGSEQKNIRGRVTSVTYEAVDDADPDTWDNASHFSYDIHGNVDILKQENKALGGGGMTVKTATYEYDLISGNVNAVNYQVGEFDEFHHKYEYDADNRVVESYTSRDGVIWEKEEKNFFYATGGLLRSEIGDKIVQATDYAYTAQGWIKGMNAGCINAQRDIGKDSYSEDIAGTTSQNRDVGLDAAGFVLGYYDGESGIKADYWSPAFASQVWSERFTPNVTSSATLADYKALYNGNISRMITALSNQYQSPIDVQLTAYQYDQLNRIKQVRAHRNYDTDDNEFEGSTGDDGKYHEDFSYDKNGNIMTALRNGDNTVGSGNQTMDDFTYHYYDNTGGIISYSSDMPLDATNKLAYVTDAAADGNYTTDIDNQVTRNYAYDGIGNLVQDQSEEIDVIDWYANGKIKSITRTSTSTKPDLEFVYDAMGNRIEKIVKPRDGSDVESQLHWTYTYYVRDAQGNVLAVYERSYVDTHADDKYEDNLKLAELDIYGSKRLGVLYSDTTQTRTFTDAGFTDADEEVFSPTYDGVGSETVCRDHCVYGFKRTLGKKAYEVSNHLGNVLATVSDRKQPVDDSSYTAWSTGRKYKYDAARNTYYQDLSGTYERVVGSDGVVDYYTADVRGYSDYFAFGARMDGRFHDDAVKYRYSFNGHEDEGEDMNSVPGSEQDLGERFYDARLGKMLSVDPLTGKYAEQSPYAYCGNSPTSSVDVNGEGTDPDNPWNVSRVTVFQFQHTIFYANGYSGQVQSKTFEAEPGSTEWFWVDQFIALHHLPSGGSANVVFDHAVWSITYFYLANDQVKVARTTSTQLQADLDNVDNSEVVHFAGQLKSFCNVAMAMGGIWEMSEFAPLDESSLGVSTSRNSFRQDCYISTYFEVTIPEGLTLASTNAGIRTAHRNYANATFFNAMESDIAFKENVNLHFGYNVSGYMSSGNTLRNPMAPIGLRAGMEWHHQPPNKLWLLEYGTHRSFENRSYLHPLPNGGGGFKAKYQQVKTG